MHRKADEAIRKLRTDIIILGKMFAGVQDIGQYMGYICEENGLIILKKNTICTQLHTMLQNRL